MILSSFVYAIYDYMQSQERFALEQRRKKLYEAGYYLVAEHLTKNDYYLFVCESMGLEKSICVDTFERFVRKNDINE
jgi:tRNA(Leu) C34 or U34 (ribose-2'-O)-methylase TrmL